MVILSLDTSEIVAGLRSRSPLDRMCFDAAREAAIPLIVSPIAVHELVSGALGSVRPDVQMALLESYLADHRYPRLEALLADIALGNRMPTQVAQVLAHRLPDKSDAVDLAFGARQGEKILITGAERGVVTFANCCMPIPGDDVMGYHTAGRGVVVHRTDCANLAEYRKSPERWVSIGWDREITGDYQVALRIEVDNRPGVLAQVAAAIAVADSNIDSVEYLDRDKNIAVIRFGIEVSDRTHLADVIRRVRRLGVVHGVQRM